MSKNTHSLSENMLSFSDMSKLKKLTQNYFGSKVSQYGISTMHAQYLIALKKRDMCSLSELSEYLDVDKANTSRAIEKLVNSGYVIKNCASDGRKWLITLTEKGEIIAEKLTFLFEDWLNIVFNGVSEEERYILIKTARIIYKNAEKFLKNQ